MADEVGPETNDSGMPVEPEEISSADYRAHEEPMTEVPDGREA
jgi:hypothetical protein